MSLAWYGRNAAAAERTRQKVRRAGVTAKGDKHWTEPERQVIEEIRSDFDAIQKRLPHRTRKAIEHQCRKMGLRQRPQHNWSAAELSRLRRMYLKASAQEICEAFPHSTWINIRQVARYYGCQRDRRTPYKIIGIPALDDVRQRCFDIRWTMRDLDQAAKTRGYFERAGWIGKKSINHRALGRAIEALDGVVQAQWRE